MKKRILLIVLLILLICCSIIGIFIFIKQKDFIQVTGLSDLGDYNVDFSNVNSSVVGEYIAKVSIENIDSNKTEKEIIIPEVKVENEQENITTEQSKNDASNKTTTSQSATSSSNVQNTLTTEKPAEQKPAEQKPTEQKPAEQKPVEQKPTEQKPVEQKPVEQKPVEQKPTEQKPAEQKPVEQKPTEQKPVEQKPERCTNNNNHGMSMGNSNKWFSTKNEAISYYNSKIKYWGKLWENFEIEDEVYYKNCPTGYEVWSCMYCNKWTINFYYR